MNERSIQLNQPNVIGTIHSPGGFAAAAAAEIDAVEVRVDHLPEGLVAAGFETLTVPAILTVRRYDEGGGRAFADDLAREDLYLNFLEMAAAVDLEGRSLASLSGVAKRTKEAGRLLIVSYHDFRTTPSAAELAHMIEEARDAGADVVKIAAVTESVREVGRLLELLEEPPCPLSVMGMGTLGRASRLLFAKAGSVLNYGWLDQPQVPGQWSAAEFGALLRRA